MIQEEMKRVCAVIDMLFSKTMKQIFTQQCGAEETYLLFTINNKTDHRKYLYYKRNDEWIIETAEDIKNVEETVNDTDFFVQVKLKFPRIKSKIITLQCRCESLCFQQNCGGTYFRKVMSLLFDMIQDWCNTVRDGDESKFELYIERIENTDQLIGKIMEKAAYILREYIECLYAPLDFSTIISLSGEYYEKSECESDILFLPKVENGNHAIRSVNLIYDFRNSQDEESDILFVAENIRWIRKLLQMAQAKRGLCLILQASSQECVYKAVGICEIKQYLKEDNTAPYLYVRFKRHMVWEMYLGKTYIFSYKSGHFKIDVRLSASALAEKCRRFFCKDTLCQNVVESIEKCMIQSHGTILVILETDDAISEVERLGQHGYGMKNASPGGRTEFVDALSAIDGALIMDTKGEIHGIGIILDGEAEVEGSMARGARYNSSLKYLRALQKKKMKGMLMIVSEDGSIELMSQNVGKIGS